MFIQLPNSFGDAATNMAIDAALLESLPAGTAVFRHYGWTEPAYTFGYTQSFSAVTAVTHGELTLCRRLTGGGIVDHRNDWTYALILQRDLATARIPANSLYEQLHRTIQATLATQLIQTQLAPCPRICGQRTAKDPASPDQCFVSPAANDVLRPDGTKIAGAAMKRVREGLLIQGSIDRASLPTDFDFISFGQTLCSNLAQTFELSIGIPEDLRTLFDGAKIQLQKARFESAEWTQKR